jgi:hypothetical protein
MRMLIVAGGAAALLLAAGLCQAAAPVKFSCSGKQVDAARRIAHENKLALGMQPKACFGRMKLTPSDRHQIVVAAPASSCKGRGHHLLNVYDQSRAGPWYALFRHPVCGRSISVGPRSPYGDNMITIDGHHYMEKGADWVRVK